MVLEVVEAVGKESPRLPEAVELLPAPGVQDEHLRRRVLRRLDLLDVDESALLDADEQHADGALGDVCEALLPEEGGDLLPVRRSSHEHGEDDPLRMPLSISVSCLGTEPPSSPGLQEERLARRRRVLRGWQGKPQLNAPCVRRCC
jgi:hypothetical protein